MRLDEITNALLGKYKKAAGKDASEADAKGDFKKGDKRFKGVVKATKKEFDNDKKSGQLTELSKKTLKSYIDKKEETPQTLHTKRDEKNIEKAEKKSAEKDKVDEGVDSE